MQQGRERMWSSYHAMRTSSEILEGGLLYCEMQFTTYIVLKCYGQILQKEAFPVVTQNTSTSTSLPAISYQELNMLLGIYAEM